MGQNIHSRFLFCLFTTVTIEPRSAVIPGSGLTTSSSYVEKLLNTCANCTVSREKSSGEAYIIYEDEKTGVYHQIFYPDKESTKEKLSFAFEKDIGGVAVWALGYEDTQILAPFKDYLEGRAL